MRALARSRCHRDTRRKTVEATRQSKTAADTCETLGRGRGNAGGGRHEDGGEPRHMAQKQGTLLGWQFPRKYRKKSFGRGGLRTTKGVGEGQAALRCLVPAAGPASPGAQECTRRGPAPNAPQVSPEAGTCRGARRTCASTALGEASASSSDITLSAAFTAPISCPCSRSRRHSTLPIDIRCASRTHPSGAFSPQRS